MPLVVSGERLFFGIPVERLLLVIPGERSETRNPETTPALAAVVHPLPGFRIGAARRPE